MQTIYEECEPAEGEDIPQTPPRTPGPTSTSSITEAANHMSIIDLEDPSQQLPDEIIAAVKAADWKLVEKLDIPHIQVTVDNLAMPNPAIDSLAYDGDHGEAFKKRREKYVNDERMRILLSLRYETEFSIEDFGSYREENQFQIWKKTFSSRKAANEDAIAQFQSWMTTVTLVKSHWISIMGNEYAEANQVGYHVDADGCITLAASRFNDEWNLRVQAKRLD